MHNALDVAGDIHHSDDVGWWLEFSNRVCSGKVLRAGATFAIRRLKYPMQFVVGQRHRQADEMLLFCVESLGLPSEAQNQLKRDMIFFAINLQLLFRHSRLRGELM